MRRCHGRTPPEHLLGRLNLRGVIVPVIDLRASFYGQAPGSAAGFGWKPPRAPGRMLRQPMKGSKRGLSRWSWLPLERNGAQRHHGKPRQH